MCLKSVHIGTGLLSLQLRIFGLYLCMYLCVSLLSNTVDYNESTVAGWRFTFIYNFKTSHSYCSSLNDQNDTSWVMVKWCLGNQGFG